MRGSVWNLGRVLGGVVAASGAGCVSLDAHTRLQASHRLVIAEKEQLSQELFDERNVNDSLRARATSLERELQAKEELTANLRRESELLDEMRRTATGALEGMAGRTFGDIRIEGPKLPAPLHAAIKRFADEHPSEVAYDAARGTVKWKADLLFPLGSDVVKEPSAEGLKAFTEIMKSPAAADFEVVVVGHTDTKPIQRAETKAKHPTNWHLSTHRAVAVGSFLQKFGYTPNRIAAMGCGEYRPVTSNDSEEGASQNRRVEIYIVPLGSVVTTSTAANWSKTLDEALAFVPEQP